MIRTIDDAREWHTSVQRLAGLTKRLARWFEDYERDGSRTLDDTIYRDQAFRELDATDLIQLAERVRKDLDDLTVLLIFSVFEARVRDSALEELKKLTPTIPEHPVLQASLVEAIDRIEHGSFGRLTEALGGSAKDLRTQVDQVRRYRNWVAHGRRGDPTDNITPTDAIARLQQFLLLLGPPPPPD